MNDCVWDAYKDHLAYLGLKPKRGEKLYYLRYKWQYLRSLRQPLYGGLVEPLLVSLCMRRNDIYPLFQYRVWTPACYLAAAPNKYIRNLLNILKGQIAFMDLVLMMCDGGEVNKITYQPAIYLDIEHHHAVFSEKVPSFGNIMMAIKIIKEGEE